MHTVHDNCHANKPVQRADREIAKGRKREREQDRFLFIGPGCIQVARTGVPPSFSLRVFALSRFRDFIPPPDVSIGATHDDKLPNESLH
jgi:hypothetical protein